MDDSKEAILKRASQRVIDKLSLWAPTHPGLIEIRATLLVELPSIIEDEHEA